MPERSGRRAAATGVIAVSAIAAVPLAQHHPPVVAALAYVAILATGRSGLPWLGYTMVGRVARRLARVAIFFIPLPFIDNVHWSWSTSASLAAVGCAVLLLAPDYKTIKRELAPNRFASHPYRSRDEPLRDVIVFAGSGVAQEYFYRGVVLISLLPYIGWFAILPAAALFMLEHVAQGRTGLYFDRRDLAVQAIMSIAFGALAIQSDSVLPAVIGHTVYNMPNLVQVAMRLHAQRSDGGVRHDVRAS